MSVLQIELDYTVDALRLNLDALQATKLRYGEYYPAFLKRREELLTTYYRLLRQLYH